MSLAAWIRMQLDGADLPPVSAPSPGGKRRRRLIRTPRGSTNPPATDVRRSSRAARAIGGRGPGHFPRLGENMSRRKYGVLAAAAVIGALAVAHLAGSSGGSTTSHLSKFARGGTEARASSGAVDMAGEGPMDGFEAYMSAARTYPADVISPAIANKASVAFSALATRDAKKGDPNAQGRKWFFYGPKRSATQPGVTAFSGATNDTASRITALVVAPDCNAVKKTCRVWVGASGGGIWRTDYALAGDPQWNQVGPDDLDQNSVGALVLDPSDPTGNTLYPRHGRGQPLQLRLRGGRRPLQDDRRRRPLDEARRRVRQQRDLYVRQPREGRVPRPRHQRDRDRPAEPQPHLRGLGPGRPRALAHDRQRRNDPPRAGR